MRSRTTARPTSRVSPDGPSSIQLFNSTLDGAVQWHVPVPWGIGARRRGCVGWYGGGKVGGSYGGVVRCFRGLTYRPLRSALPRWRVAMAQRWLAPPPATVRWRRGGWYRYQPPSVCAEGGRKRAHTHPRKQTYRSSAVPVVQWRGRADIGVTIRWVATFSKVTCG